MFPDLFRDDVLRIESPRLWLRWPRFADAPALQAIAAVKEIAEMTATWPHPLPEGEALERIVRARTANAAGKAATLAITWKRQPGEIVGLLGAHATSDGAAVLGYLLAVEAQGRGVMSEAVKGLAAALFVYGGVQVLKASSRTINHASRRVLEKNGFRLIGSGPCKAVARGGAVPADNFELTRADWLATASQPPRGPVLPRPPNEPGAVQQARHFTFTSKASDNRAHRQQSDTA